MAQTKIRKQQINSITLSQIEDYVPVTVTDSSEIDLTVTGQDITASLKTTAVSSGTYNSANITVDSKGRITSASNGSPSAKAIIEGGVTGGYWWWTECTDNGNMTATSTGSNTRTVKAGEANHQGIFNIQSTGVSTNNGYRWNTGTTGADQFLIQGGEKAICIFRTPADLTKTNLAVGFMDANFGTQVDAVMIYFNGTSSVYGMTSSNSVATTSSAITTLSNSTWYRFEVEVNSNATAVDFKVYDGTGAVLGTQQITTNIPTGSGRTLFGNMYILSATAAVSDLGDVDYIAIATGPMVR